MIESTSDKIIKYISQNRQASGRELTAYLKNISSRAVRKQLKKLFDMGILQKIGKPPSVYYLLADKKEIIEELKIKKDLIRFIDSRYLYITPIGEFKEGWQGFIEWCNKTKQEPTKTAGDYIETIKKFDRFKKNGLIDGMLKIKNTFKNVFLDKLFYLDFYSVERFGKTKLGQMLLYAKQSQNTDLIRNLIDKIRPQIIKVIEKENIDGVLFVPPTVKRETQFMKELEENLSLPIKTVLVKKIKTEIIVPQKTLSKLDDRIENAKRTIIVEEKGKFKNILLIDDAVGSGSTMNETAKQIQKRGIVKGKIIGLAITGSFRGFDVISEV